MHNKELIIIPVYNEELYIGNVLKGIKEHYPNADILVVNDCSTDKSVEIIKQEEDVILINLPFNCGYGVALQTGFKYAYKNKYDYVVTMDGDGQHPPSELSRLFEEIKTNKYDLIIGSRFLKNADFPMPIAKKVAIFLFKKIIKLYTGISITDPTSGFQALGKNILKFYISKYYPIDYPDADLIIMIHKAGYRMNEIPILMLPNPKTKTMHSGLKPLYYMFKMTISILTILLRTKKHYEQSE
jgi:glycosyltransferase involved in cell wall biosynthesis